MRVTWEVIYVRSLVASHVQHQPIFNSMLIPCDRNDNFQTFPEKNFFLSRAKANHFQLHLIQNTIQNQPSSSARVMKVWTFLPAEGMRNEIRSKKWLPRTPVRLVVQDHGRSHRKLSKFYNLEKLRKHPEKKQQNLYARTYLQFYDFTNYCGTERKVRKLRVQLAKSIESLLPGSIWRDVQSASTV